MAKRANIRKCLICNKRPAVTERGYCHNCQTSLDAERRRKRERNKADKYVTYRGTTVALRMNNGEYKVAYTTLNPERIAKCRLINLDTYCKGFTREQIKKLKRLCLAFAK